MTRVLREIAATAVVLVFALTAGSASAGQITDTITFTASGFTPLGGSTATPPVSTVTGSFTVTLDPTVNSGGGSNPVDVLTGITLNSLNLNFNSTKLAYNYALVALPPTFPLPFFSAFQVGGTAITPGDQVNGVTSQTDDFVLGIDDLAKVFIINSDPTFSFLNYSQAGSNSTFQSTDVTGTITGTSVTAVPEPASLFAVAAGLGGLGLLRRRRKTQA